MTASVGELVWPTNRIGAVGEVTTGQQKRADDGSDPLFRYLRVANIGDGYIDGSDVLRMPFSPRNRERLSLQPGDILLCEGQSPELVGRAAMYRGEPSDACFQNTLLRFRPGSAVHPEYALLVFRAYQASGVFRRIAKTTTNLAHLGAKRFAELPFPLPPMPQQQTIANLVGVAEQQIVAAQDAATSQAEAVRHVLPAARDQLLFQDFRTQQFSELASLVDPSTPIAYGVLKPGPRYSKETGIPLIRQVDLQDGHVESSDLYHISPALADSYPRSRVSAGEIILGIIRNTRASLVPDELSGAQVTRGVARVRPSSAMNGGYLYHCIASRSSQSWLRHRMRGIDMPGLNLRDIRRMPIPVRPLVEQIRINATLDDIAREVDSAAILVDSIVSDIKLLRLRVLTGFTYGPESREVSEMSDALANLLRSINAASPSARATSTRPSNGSSDRQDFDSRVESGRKKVSYDLTPHHMLAAIADSGGAVSPEELFDTMSLAPYDADDFFSVLRTLVAANSVEIRRPDAQTVEIVTAA